MLLNHDYSYIQFLGVLRLQLDEECDQLRNLVKSNRWLPSLGMDDRKLKAEYKKVQPTVKHSGGNVLIFKIYIAAGALRNLVIIYGIMDKTVFLTI